MMQAHQLNPPLPHHSPIDILIVDDVLENLQLLGKILEQNGYLTRKAMSGKMALNAVAECQPDLILLDIRMPGMNGYEVCQQLKSSPNTASIPIVFLSAASNIEDKVEAFKIGGSDYITKPFHAEEVLARVQHQLTIITAHQTIQRLNAQLEARVRERTQQLELANAQLSAMAFCDPLTQLPNRALLMHQLQQTLEQQRDLDAPFAVFYLDCDRFKSVNDALGHQAGDELLIAMAQRLRSVLRQDDLLARLGGDEFVILLNQITTSNVVIQVVERIFDRFAAPFRLRGQDIFISFSVGIVLNGSTYQNPEDLLRDADIAMYQAKASGKNQYCVFNASMQPQTQCLQLETDLRKAIQQQQLFLHYQPIVELATNKIVTAEALLRWQHPTQGLIPPSQFIPIAEETGLILKLGDWIMQEACRQLHCWQKQKIVDAAFSVSVNVSAYQFIQPNFVEKIDAVLGKTQVNPGCLKLEITETVFMQNFTAAADIARQLRDRGIQLSIDDFGTGYSSLSYLHSFPVDTIKIDRSFIQRLHQQTGSLELVTAIAQIAKTMGMSLVAEGIETSEQLAQLKLLACQFGQGYLFSRPVDSEAAANLFAMPLGQKRSSNSVEVKSASCDSRSVL
jgi:diguanylate cyclase (GGDEF)-like protein